MAHFTALIYGKFPKRKAQQPISQMEYPYIAADISRKTATKRHRKSEKPNRWQPRTQTQTRRNTVRLLMSVDLHFYIRRIPALHSRPSRYFHTHHELNIVRYGTVIGYMKRDIYEINSHYGDTTSSSLHP